MTNNDVMFGFSNIKKVFDHTPGKKWPLVLFMTGKILVFNNSRAPVVQNHNIIGSLILEELSSSLYAMKLMSIHWMYNSGITSFTELHSVLFHDSTSGHTLYIRNLIPGELEPWRGGCSYY